MPTPISSGGVGLPLYSPSSAAPSYAPEPSEDEQRLEFVARHQPRAIPNGNIIRKLRRVTVVFSEQEIDASIPSYTRNGVVKGEVCLDSLKAVSVKIKLEGRLALTIAEGGTAYHDIITETSVLWTKSDSSTCCPTKLLFRIPFPHTFQDRDRVRHPLPPSYNTQSLGIPGLSGKCIYSLTVIVTKSRLGAWKRHKHVTFPIDFRPRSRPFLPTPPDLLPFSSTVKSAAGEWRQIISSMSARESSSLTPIECQLFIPSVQIYSISDVIPFHLQLCGQPASLQALVSPPSPSIEQLRSKGKRRASPTSRSMSVPNPHIPRRATDSQWSTSSPHFNTHLSTIMPEPSAFFTTRAYSWPLLPEPPPGRRSPYPDDQSGQPTIRVFLLRQICARVHGQKAWRNTVLGEGKLWPVESQVPAHGSDRAVNDTTTTMDWDGEVRCSDNVNVGGFNAGELLVKDFIMLELKPPLPHSSPLVEHQHAHPIRLVTDPYNDP